MLPSTGYFKGINCPYYENGLCERPYCHFKHSRRDASNTAVPLQSNSNQIIQNPQNIETTPITTTPDPDVLKQLVSEAVKQVLADEYGSNTDKFSQNLVSKVVEGLKPTFNPSSVPTNISSTILTNPVIGKHTGIPIQPTARPSSQCVYNPTPISELRKRHLPVASYMPPVESKVVLKRKSPDGDKPWMDVIRNIPNFKDSKYKYSPTLANSSEKNVGGLDYVPTAMSSSSSNLYGQIDTENAKTKETYLPKPKKRREEYVPKNPSRRFKPKLIVDDDEDDVMINNLVHQYSAFDDMYNSESNPSVSYDDASQDLMDVDYNNIEEHIYENKIDESEYVPEYKTIKNKKEDQQETANSKEGEENLKENVTLQSQNIEDQSVSKSSDKLNKENKKLDTSQKIDKSKEKSKDRHRDRSKDQNKEKSKNGNKEQSKNKNQSSERSDGHRAKDGSKDKSNDNKDHTKSKNKDQHKEKDKDKHRSSSKTSDKEKSSSSSSKSKSRHKDKNRNKDDKTSNKNLNESDKKDSKSDKDKPSSTTSSKSEKADSKSKNKKSKSDSTSKHKSSKSSSNDSKNKSNSESSKSTRDHESKSSQKSSKINKSDSKSRSEKLFEDNQSDSDFEQVASSPQPQFSPYYDEVVNDVSDSDHDVEEECRKIFQEFEEFEPKDVTSKAPTKQKVKESEDASKKRVAHSSAESSIVKQIRPTQPLKPLQNPQQKMYERWKAMQKIAAEKSQSTNSDHPINGNGRVRIAQVPYAMSLTLEKKKVLENLAKKESKTAAQTVKKGVRVAHISQAMPELIRPAPLQTSSQKFPLNVRQHYINAMHDICIQIYNSSDDAIQRALREELACHDRCKALTVYKNACMLAVHRLRKEVDQDKYEAGASGLISHETVLAGKTKGSWSVIKPKKIVTDFKGSSLYEMLVKFILTEQEMKDNGYPRPHPDGSKGRAKLYVSSVKGKSSLSKVPNERFCCRCGKAFMVDKHGLAVRKENCIYHWARKFTMRGESRYACCKQDSSSDGCCDAKSHVWDYVDPENLTGFVSTFDRDKQPEEQGIYALDCEMCYTTQGLELTRVTVVDEDSQVVYETLVKPLHDIIDYNTRFSGITEQDMEDVTTTLQDVHGALLTLFSSKTILIGHSLESDLKALKLLHETIIDTSVMFPHKNGPPFKKALKTLCSEYLQKIIQNDVGGHDSKEDAVACMELVHWKIKELAKLL